MEVFWDLLKAFVVGGLICVVGQILIDKTSLTPARILTGYVVTGVILGAVGLYPILVDFAGAGATVPLTGFGNSLAAGVREAVAAAKAYAPFVRKIEVETENLDMVKDAVDAGADIIMLDNMTPEQMAEAIRLIDGRAKTECSGNMTKENIRTVTELGVDYVSSGALTHSAPILDISLKHLKVLTD